jgi:hypothetical protein
MGPVDRATCISGGDIFAHDDGMANGADVIVNNQSNQVAESNLRAGGQDSLLVCVPSQKDASRNNILFLLR